MRAPLLRRVAVTTTTAILAGGLTVIGATAASAADHPVINEFSANIVGTETAGTEFVEVQFTANADLTGHSVLLVEGDANSSRGRIQTVLPVGTLDENGLALLDATGLQNGTQSILLVTGDLAGVAAGADIDANDDGTIDESWAFTLVDGVGVSDGGTGDLVYGTFLANDFDGGSNTPGGASRLPDGTDTDTAADWLRNDFDGAGFAGFTGTPAVGEALNTPGQPNEAVEDDGPDPGTGTCADPATIGIHEVQGAGAASPLVGQTVQIEGVVTGDFQVGGYAGYAVQEEDAQTDADPATSEAIFVYAPGGAEVAEGDIVHVTGVVSEFSGLTEVTVSDVVVCSSGAALPAATTIEIPLDTEESLESMLVTIPQELTISELYDYGRYGTVALTVGTQSTPTAVFDAGSPEAIALHDANWDERILLDDGQSAQNPDPALHPDGEEFTLDNGFRRGDLVANVTGVLDFRNDEWRVQPTEGADYTQANPRPDVPEIGGSLTVASFNVLNYFTTIGDRGAQTPQEFDRQETKIVAAILEIDAAVVGLLEIENNDGVALETLVAALNEVAGEGTYAGIATGTLGTDVITTALIYQPALVSPVGAHAVLDESIDPRFDTAYNRPALAQTFLDLESNAMLTVAVNHLKSKGSGCEANGDPIDPNGQGNCNLTRLAAAEALTDWLATNPTGADTDDVLIMGDLNAYDHEDPIQAIEAAGYVDTIRVHSGEEAYSYEFDGMVGYLDHALASPTLAGQVTGSAPWHANADEVSLIDYTMQFKAPAQDALWAPDAYRASDHDAIVVGLDLDAPTVEEPEVATLAGTNRYASSAAVSQLLFEAGTDVYLASGVDFADALAAGPAAAHDDASLLLTPSDRLLDVTTGEIDRLTPASITIVGGTSAISADVEAQLTSLYPEATITRIAGVNRFATAAAIATEVFGTADTVFVASGLDFADALSASGVAATLGDAPVLLTTPTSAPEATIDAIDALGATEVVVVGGRAAVSDAVVRALRADDRTVTRESGSDRFATNAQLVEAFVEPTTPQAIVMATGSSFPDALSATALAGAMGAPLLLANGSCVTLDVEEAIAGFDPSTVYNVGGAAVLAPEAWQTGC